MFKQKYKLYIIAGLSFLLCLTLSACLQGDQMGQLKQMQEQNQALQTEIASLQAALKDAQASAQEPGLSPETPSAEPSSSKTPTPSSDRPSARPSAEDEFVYRGNLEVNGKRVADMSREEIEALPTMGAPVTDVKTGKTTMIYPPEGIKNLYEQLAYVDRLTRYMTWGPDVPEDKPVDLGAYDISHKTLLVRHDPESDLDQLYELEGKDQETLDQWLDANLGQALAEARPNFSYDSQIFTPQGDHIYFSQADFLEGQTQPYAYMRKGQDQFFQIDLKSPAATAFKGLLSPAQAKLIYDEEKEVSQTSEDKPVHSLQLATSREADLEKVSFRVTNPQKEGWAFRNFYKLFYYEGESWFQMEPTQVGECYEAREDLVLPAETREITINYGSCYGDLAPGYYRLEVGMETQPEKTSGTVPTLRANRENYVIYFVIR